MIAAVSGPLKRAAIYALALTRLVPGLKLFDIKCTWFASAYAAIVTGLNADTTSIKSANNSGKPTSRMLTNPPVSPRIILADRIRRERPAGVAQGNHPFTQATSAMVVSSNELTRPISYLPVHFAKWV